MKTIEKLILLKNNFKFIFIALCFLLSTSQPSFAEKSVSSKQAIIKGMVCAFCVDTLKKVFSKQKEVQEVQLNLDTKQLTLIFKENQTLADEKIKKLIKSSGYDVVNITEGQNP